ncbi:MAG: sulfite exporter TauE/SafE family protein [Micromonosporaceae bacterium]
MDLGDVVLLLVAGLAAGGVNALAGGGSLISFPALLATGLPPVNANVTNSISVCPGYLASVYGSRADLVGQRGRAYQLMATTAVGTATGAVILLLTPARAFELVVPFLVLGATAALAFQDRLRRVVGHPQDLSPRRQRVYLHLLAGLGAVYGGYFGAALGVVLVAVLAVVLDERMARISALKNTLSVTIGLITVVVFGLFGPVHWLAVLVLAPATITGGYLGALGTRRIPSTTLRWIIVAYGTGVGVLLLVRAVA